MAAVARHRPDAVLLTAAYADVDGCEEAPEQARQVNVEGAVNVADACAQSSGSSCAWR